MSTSRVFDLKCGTCKLPSTVITETEPVYCPICGKRDIDLWEIRGEISVARFLSSFLESLGVARFCRQAEQKKAQKKNKPLSREEAAADFILSNSGLAQCTIDDLMNFREDAEYAYRTAARKLHPDTGGSHDQFIELQKMWDILERHLRKHYRA